MQVAWQICLYAMACIDTFIMDGNDSKRNKWKDVSQRYWIQ